MKRLREQLTSLQNTAEKQQYTKHEAHESIFKNKWTGSETRQNRKTFKKTTLEPKEGQKENCDTQQ